MNLLVILPILIPLAAGALSLLGRHSQRVQGALAVIGGIALVISAVALLLATWEHGHIVSELGSWPAPFGIVLVSDLLAAIMVLLSAVTGAATAFYSLGSISIAHRKAGYFPLMHLLLAGVNGAFLTGDIFNLYVWFEVMLVASFSLLILGGERAQMEGAIKYVTLNLVSSALFLSAVGLLYGLVGTLNMADIAVKLGEVDTGMTTVIAMLFMVAFGIKAAAFPFFFWLPASYHTPQVAVSALFAGLLTKVGVYALFRVFTLIFDMDDPLIHQVLLWGAGLTMVTGVLGAAAQFEFRRILSFHIVSQIGYMMMGLALASVSVLALAGGIFYIIHHIIVKANLFFVSGLVYRLRGSYELKQLGGLYRDKPWLALLFLIPALSLAGMPPLSGFFGKFIVIRGGVEAGAWTLVAAALVVGLLTLYSMTKIWAEVFWKAAPEPAATPASGSYTVLYATVTGLALITVVIGLGAQPVLVLSQAAAEQLLNPSLYITAVLGEAP